MEHDEHDPAPSLTPMTLTPIDVDVDSLAEFRAFLIREVDTNLKPAAQGISADHSMGARFGVDNAGAKIQAARRKYADTLEASTNNLAQYVATAEVFIDAIHQVASKYTAADLSSASATSKIGADLNDAVAASWKARTEAAKLLKDQETQRELHRMRGELDT